MREIENNAGAWSADRREDSDLRLWDACLQVVKCQREQLTGIIIKKIHFPPTLHGDYRTGSSATAHTTERRVVWSRARPARGGGLNRTRTHVTRGSFSNAVSELAWTVELVPHAHPHGACAIRHPDPGGPALTPPIHFDPLMSKSRTLRRADQPRCRTSRCRWRRPDELRACCLATSPCPNIASASDAGSRRLARCSSCSCTTRARLRSSSSLCT